MPGAVAAEHAELVIRPPVRWGGFGLREVWEYRELLYFLVKRELQVRYKQSALGVTWAVLQPVALTFIFALFFGRLAGVESDGVPYPVFALAGLVPWMYVSQATSQAALSLVGDANLLSKVYFPRLVIPVAKLGALGLDLLVSVVVLVPFALLYGVSIPGQIVALPAFLALAVITAAAAGIGLAALNVRYRDVTVAIPLAMQLWLFATPVVYPGSLITGGWRYVYALNPMTTVIDGVRWAVLDTRAPTLGVIAVSVTVALGGLVLAVAYFRRTERTFADLI